MAKQAGPTIKEYSAHHDIPTYPPMTEGLTRNVHVSVMAYRVDEVWEEVKKDRPDLTREQVLDVLVSNWGVACTVNTQQRLINTQKPYQLADRVITTVERLERECGERSKHGA